jgi:ribosomal peptide maturation radical SAM protein 1
MPFAELHSPALGVSLLKSTLEARGIRARIEYPTLEFGRAIGTSFYDAVSGGLPRTTALLGEWIFSHALRASSDDDVARYIGTYLADCTPAFVASVLEARARVSEFLDETLDRLLAREPLLVGFSSSFQQHVASLALARRLKARAPAIPIVFGGANCETDMGRETLRSFPFVDAVVSGEADDVIADLVADVMAGRPTAKLYGLDTEPRTDLDALPYPDFSDYFEACGDDADDALRLHFETSRGCWWGEKHHCTFCGLNGGNMAFRRKSPARAVAEIEHLATTYGVRKLSAADNILDLRYLDTVIPEIARRDLGLELFYEVKANLRRDQVRALRDAGVVRLQPGIESLSSNVLRLMRKGVSGLQNVRLLKWCRAYGIHPVWNALFGFPGEPRDEYLRMAQLIPLLTHLTPPEYVGAMRLDRFSPYFEDPLAFGISGIEPYPAYGEVYDLPAEAVRNLAYYFTFDEGSGAGRDLSYAHPFVAAVAEWRAVHERSELVAIDDGACLLVCDYRPVAVGAVTVLNERERAVLLACDDIGSLVQIHERLTAARNEDAARSLDDVIETLVARRLLVAEGDAYLSLVVDLRYAGGTFIKHLTSAQAVFSAPH